MTRDLFNSELRQLQDDVLVLAKVLTEAEIAKLSKEGATAFFGLPQ